MSILVLDVTSGKKVARKDAHSSPITTVKALAAHLVASGDEAGVLKIWDTRTPRAVHTFAKNEDFISGLYYSGDANTVVASCADGRVSVFDLRVFKAKLSNHQVDELLCVTALKNEHKVAVGSEDGVVSIYSWDNWGDCTDRIPGHPGSVDCIVKMDEDHVLTGCSDGKIRLVSVQPNSLVSILNDHELNLPIERMAIHEEYLASCSHDNKIRFWNLGNMKIEEKTRKKARKIKSEIPSSIQEDVLPEGVTVSISPNLHNVLKGQTNQANQSYILPSKTITNIDALVQEKVTKRLEEEVKKKMHFEELTSVLVEREVDLLVELQNCPKQVEKVFKEEVLLTECLRRERTLDCWKEIDDVKRIATEARRLHLRRVTETI